ncbi:hypothetical protein J2Z17_000346 [Rhizobium halophytocola]|uniref:DUF459 domain-containing protein n=2 Tax=Rhizobium halophytocola TaxID=735519 RepID=A0ABS4DTH4_9HYPH|nr:DUF459 domain-containing protein [Rhizobium halophytocola]MBP1848929.1 hypothetical protein [Rhizobium halophytocola]
MTLVSTAEAQQRRRTLLELLFGDRNPPQTEPRPRAVRRAPPARVKKSSPSRSVTTITSAPKEPAAPEKLDNARKILVVGDFFASGLANGLSEAFAQSPQVVISGHTNGSSGLVRDDYYDWPEKLPALIEEEKPAMVMIDIGANDRQQLVTDAGRYDFRTDDWYREYERRVTAFAKIATDHKIPLVWVGVPAFSSPTMTADALKLNSIYRQAATKAGGEFIDIWDGFVDVDGRFVMTGSDINGQQVRLRGSDGIGLTAAGKRKMAFYTEKAVKRVLGDLPSLDQMHLDGSNLPELVSLPPSEIQNIVKTRPIDLSDPDLDGSAGLLDAAEFKPSPIPSPRQMLVDKGDPPPAPAGRIDDFRMPGSKAPALASGPEAKAPVP